MLKIKDGINLKKLEKFGFKAFASITQPEYVEYENLGGGIWIYGDMVLVETEFIFPRRIIIRSCSNRVINTLYDLIKSDMVERIRK